MSTGNWTNRKYWNCLLKHKCLWYLISEMKYWINSANSGTCKKHKYYSCLFSWRANGAKDSVASGFSVLSLLSLNVLRNQLLWESLLSAGTKKVNTAMDQSVRKPSKMWCSSLTASYIMCAKHIEGLVWCCGFVLVSFLCWENAFGERA